MIDDEEPTSGSDGHEKKAPAEESSLWDDHTTLPPPEDQSLDLEEARITKIRRVAVICGLTVFALAVGSMAVYAAVNRPERQLTSQKRTERPISNTSARMPSALEKVRLATTPAGGSAPADDAPESASNALPMMHGAVPPISSVYRDQDEMEREAAGYERPTSYRAHISKEPKQSEEAEPADDNADMPHMDLAALKNGLRGGGRSAESSPSLPLEQQPPAMPTQAGGLGQLGQLAAALQGKDGVDDDARKENFMSRAGIQTLPGDSEPVGLCDLSAGVEIAVDLLVATNSDIPSGTTVTAVVTKEVRCGPDDEYVAIPQGSRFVGEVNHQTVYGQNRQQLCMKQLTRPPARDQRTGERNKFDCMVVADITGAPGMEADVDNHWGAVITGSILTAILSLGASSSMGQQEGFAATTAQNAAHNAGNSLNNAGNKIVQRDLQRKPTLTTRALRGVTIMFTANLPLSPWLPRTWKQRHHS